MRYRRHVNAASASRPYRPARTGTGVGAAARGGRGRGRGRRPNVRGAVLALLTERPMHGYEMIQEIDSRTGGVWRPEPRLGLPDPATAGGRGPDRRQRRGRGGRKRFDLTDAGREEATTAAQTPPWAEFAEDTVNSWHDIRDAGAQAMHALRQVR